MSAWRAARSIEVLRNEVNAEFPGRDKASDGIIGNAEHASRQSDHNPNARGVVRAIDVDAGPGLNPSESRDKVGDTVAEAARAALMTHFGVFKYFKTRHPAMGRGSYVIHERMICS